MSRRVYDKWGLEYLTLYYWDDSCEEEPLGLFALLALRESMPRLKKSRLLYE
jgi:hypothetical protein